MTELLQDGFSVHDRVMQWWVWHRTVPTACWENGTIFSVLGLWVSTAQSLLIHWHNTVQLIQLTAITYVLFTAHACVLALFYSPVPFLICRTGCHCQL